MGNIADKLVYENHLENLARPIEYIRSQGLIAGTAGHAIKVPMACVENGIETDFFMKTFHDDKYWSAQPRLMPVVLNFQNKDWIIICPMIIYGVCQIRILQISLKIMQLPG